MATPPRVAICGIHIESSTFSPHVATVNDFDVRRGDDVVARYPFLAPGTELSRAAAYTGILHARALPGGAVDADTYAALRAEILAGLAAAGPWDGILLDIHGAMSVRGIDDAEGDFSAAIRAAVGAGPVISAAMDLHGNVSPQLFADCDLLTCYRTAPHVDVWETRERALRGLLDALRRGVRPAKALAHVPLLLPGEMTSTRMEPARSLYARLDSVDALPGIVDAALWIGFAWADEPRNRAAIVVTGYDRDAVTEQARALQHALYDARHAFAFVAPTGSFAACLSQALNSPARPFLLSDSGDNPGAGGAGDCTACLAALLAEPRVVGGEVSAVVASIVDPAAVEQAEAVGIGNEAQFTIGARIDTRAPGPQRLRAVVETATADPSTGHHTVCLRAGGLRVIVTSAREQFSTLAQFRRAGVDPANTDIIVVKMGYLEPELYDLQRGWLLALTPGGVDQELRRLGHRRVTRPMIPFDDDAPEPAGLTAVCDACPV